VSQKWTKSAPKVSQKYTKSAPKVSQKRAKSGPKVHQKCPKSAPKVYQKCAKSVPKVPQKCPKRPSRGSRCSISTVSYSRHCIACREPWALPLVMLHAIKGWGVPPERCGEPVGGGLVPLAYMYRSVLCVPRTHSGACEPFSSSLSHGLDPRQ